MLLPLHNAFLFLLFRFVYILLLLVPSVSFFNYPFLSCFSLFILRHFPFRFSFIILKSSYFVYFLFPLIFIIIIIMFMKG